MAKLTKSQLVEGLREILEGVTLDEGTVELVEYTVNQFEVNARNITMDDINDTISALQEDTGRNFEDLLAEARGVEAEVEEAEEEEVAEEQVEGEEVESAPIEQIKKEVPKKTLPKKQDTKVENSDKKPVIKAKADAKKETPKKEEKPKTVHKTTELLAQFPETLKSKVLKGATLKLRNDLTNIKELAEAYNNEEDIVLATYWTERHLRQFGASYDPMQINPKKPKSFEHDLDLIEITYANELVVTGCSLYSYVPQIFVPMDFEIHEGNLRYANGMEFQVYEVVEE